MSCPPPLAELEIQMKCTLSVASYDFLLIFDIYLALGDYCLTFCNKV